MKTKILFLLILSSFSSYSQTLITDTLFGNSGETFSPTIPNAAGGGIQNVLVLSDNSILMCGFIYDITNNAFNNVMLKTNSCGDLDQSFGVNGYVQHTFDQRNSGYDYKIQNDGKILVCGTQSDGNSGSQQFPFLARYHANGSPDSTFGVSGTKKINYLGPQDFTSLYLMPDGKIVCTNGGFIMRFNTDGSVDDTFGNAGLILMPAPPEAQWSYSNASAIRSDGKIVSAATWFNGAGTYLGLLCYDTLGVIDSTFATNGFLFSTTTEYGAMGWRIFAQNNNKVIVARQNSQENTIIIARYTVNGNLDLTFGINGYIIINSLSSPMRVQSLIKFDDDSFIISYSENGIPPHFNKYTADGIIDSAFTINGSSYFQFSDNYAYVHAGIASGNGEITMGGFIGLSGARMALTRVVLNTSVPDITQNTYTLYSNVLASNCTFQWYLNNVAIEGATDSTLIITENGNYMVSSTNEWGCEASNTFNVTEVGINRLSALNSITVFPNPAIDYLTINNPSNKIIQANIYDISGRKMSTLNVQSGNNNIQLNDYSNGVYLIEFSDGLNITRRKFIKN